jgi:hypothetical protein
MRPGKSRHESAAKVQDACLGGNKLMFIYQLRNSINETGKDEENWAVEVISKGKSPQTGEFL